MAAARCPEKVKALIIEDPTLTLENYKRIIDSSRDMFNLWLDLKKSARSEKELSLAWADRYKDYPGVTMRAITINDGKIIRIVEG
jgi:pimeloyl-ACP methyl ester carboxylesterase